MKALRKSFGWALRGLGVGMVILAVAAFALLAIGPRTGRYRTFTVLTESMRPSFSAGSIVLVVPTPIEEIVVGDVLTYHVPVEDHRVITHRVVDVLEPGVVRTKGDANDVVDPWVAKLQGDVAWKVRAGVPAAGFVLNLLRQPVAQAFATLLPTSIVLVMGLRRIWRGARLGV